MDSGFLDSEMEIETVEIDSRNYKLTQDQNQATVKRYFSIIYEIWMAKGFTL